MYTKFCIQTDGHGISSIPQTFIGGYNKQTLLAFDRILVPGNSKIDQKHGV